MYSQKGLEFYNKAKTFESQGNYREAIQVYDEVLRIDPKSASAWHNKGAVFIQLGDYATALSCIENALQLQPSSAEMCCTKGVVLCKQGKYQEGIACFDKTLAKIPNDQTALSSKMHALSAIAQQKQLAQQQQQAEYQKQLIAEQERKNREVERQRQLLQAQEIERQRRLRLEKERKLREEKEKSELKNSLANELNQGQFELHRATGNNLKVDYQSNLLNSSLRTNRLVFRALINQLKITSMAHHIEDIKFEDGLLLIETKNPQSRDSFQEFLGDALAPAAPVYNL